MAKRDEIVSIRLTAEERAWLATLGRPTDVLRELLLASHNRGRKAVDLMEHVSRPSVIWQDGTTGQNWPAVMTRA